MDEASKKKLELDLLLEAIFRRYGYDFRSYAQASLVRRLTDFMLSQGMMHFSEMVPRVVRDERFFGQLLKDLSVSTTEMFRDPRFHKAVREKIVPFLKTFAFVKVWHPGCSTGQEAYSMAIILHEEGLLERCIIYATDLNPHALDLAKEGIYEAAEVKRCTSNYMRSGAMASLSDYYHAHYGHVRFAPFLRERITFAGHNLVTDQSFGEMNLIVCRNVLIYFNRSLQERVLGLFCRSLCHRGYLCIGMKERFTSAEAAGRFEAISGKEGIYRRL